MRKAVRQDQRKLESPDIAKLEMIKEIAKQNFSKTKGDQSLRSNVAQWNLYCSAAFPVQIKWILFFEELPATMKLNAI